VAAAEVLAANGLKPLLCNRDAPTPVIAHTIRKRKAAGGINMTASHNPAEYQGLKFSTSNGAPAHPEVTKQIEANVARLQEQNWSFKGTVVGNYQCKTIDPQPDYFKQLRKLIDFSAIKKARLRIAVELMYGTGRGYLDRLLEEAGAHVTRFHDELNPLFGGHHPEPNAEGMVEVSKLVRSGKASLGLGLDGDADRFGIADADDVANEAIGRLIRLYPHIIELKDLIPLTIEIATNVIYHVWRDKTKGSRHDSIDELDHPTKDISQEQHFHWKSLADRVISILGSKRLKPRCMKLFQLIYEGHDFRLISQGRHKSFGKDLVYEVWALRL